MRDTYKGHKYSCATSNWIRVNTTIPHDAYSFTDIDFITLKYNDPKALRYMYVELKTYGKKMYKCSEDKALFAQIEAHMILDHNGRLTNNSKFKTPKGKYKELKYMGCHLLTLSGDSPSNSNIYLDNRIMLTEDQLSDFFAFKLDDNIYKQGDPNMWYNRKPKIDMDLTLKEN